MATNKDTSWGSRQLPIPLNAADSEILRSGLDTVEWLMEQMGISDVAGIRRQLNEGIGARDRGGNLQLDSGLFTLLLLAGAMSKLGTARSTSAGSKKRKQDAADLAKARKILADADAEAVAVDLPDAKQAARKRGVVAL